MILLRDKQTNTGENITSLAEVMTFNSDDICRCYAPSLIGGSIKRCLYLTFVCLTSVAYIGPKSRIERRRKTKIGTEVAHVTRDSDTTFEVKRSRSPGRFTWRGLNAQGGCSGQRGNVFGVGKYCYYVASARRRAKRWAPTEGGERRGHIVSPRAQLVTVVCILESFWSGHSV